MKITQKIGSGFLVLAMAVTVFGGSFSTANAQTTYYNNNDIDSMIAYVQSLLVQLQQLKALQAQQQSGYHYQYNYQYQPYGQVLGVNTGSGRVEVDTIGVGNTYRDETTLYAEVDLNGAAYAYVWFEYGEDDDMDDRTEKVRITNSHHSRFSARVYNLDEDERFYFRAVAEGPNGRRDYGQEKMFILDDYNWDWDDDDDRYRYRDDEPDVETGDADDIEDGRATLSGEVDMNDFYDGLVFFVWGEDEDRVEDIEDEDEFDDIDEKGDDLQKQRVDSDLDGDEEYERSVYDLDENSEYFFRICVEYEDEDGDETLECGSVEEFDT